MNVAPSLPAASPSTVLAVFLRILEADPTTTFKRWDLEQQGIAQCRQAVTLLRFLRLVTDAGRLENDVLELRAQPRKFRELLHQRLERACREAECWTEELVGFGLREWDDPRELTELLYRLAPVQRQKSRAAKTNMVGCLRTLHHAILHCDDRAWLENERNARQRGEGKARADAAGGEPAGSRGSGRGVSRPVKSVETVESERFHIDFTEEGEKVFVEAWFSPPLGTLSRKQLLSLARQLEERARAMPIGPVRR